MAESTDYFAKWGFTENYQRGYLEYLAAGVGSSAADGFALLDRLFEKYGATEPTRTAARLLWDFRGGGGTLLVRSPEGIEAAFRFMKVSGDSGVGLLERQKILQRILGTWGLGDDAARERAEGELNKRAGSHLSDDRVLREFMAARVEHVKALNEQVDTCEARTYLKAYPQRGALAANRFGSTPGSAAEFVEALYSAGATKVVVENICYDHQQREGSPFSDSVRVHLPSDQAGRAAVFDVIDRMARLEEPVTDEGDHSVGLWWD
ncbi:MAG TPA: hypothetical protein VFP85_01395 [Vicinamibacterales bacterium]|nr:hypothetical protein [Vicinamibacterales bacterium]